jgi:ABC-type transport system involved in multi-copper enzyme maturation permease subunit
MLEIFRTEMRGSIFGGKALTAFILMTLAFLISLGMMSQEYQKRLDNYGASISLPSKDLFWNKLFVWWFDDGNFTESDNATMPLGKVKEPDPLMFFARGFDTEMRQGIDFFSTFPIIDLNKQPEQEKNMLFLLFPALDMLFMIKVLVSLLAMLFAHDTICGERENGTLKLMLVSGASRGAIFGGKFLGGLVSIALAFTAAFIVSLLALSFLAPVNIGGDIPARIALIYLVGLLHIAVFFGLGAVISAFTRGTASALVLTLFVWIVVVLVLPGLASLGAQQFAPVDSEEKLAQMKFKKAREMEAAYSAANPGSDRSYTGAYGVRHDEIRDQIVAELQKIEDEHQRRKERQITLTCNLARVSPAGSLSHLLTSLSRTGIDDVKLYRADLIRIRNNMETQFTAAMQDPRLWSKWMEVEWEIPQEIKDLATPWFDIGRTVKFSTPDLARTMESTWLDFALLAFFAVAPAAMSFFRFIFYDPR